MISDYVTREEFDKVEEAGHRMGRALRSLLDLVAAASPGAFHGRDGSLFTAVHHAENTLEVWASAHRVLGLIPVLDAVSRDIVEWGTKTFPRATPESISEHLRREAEELAKAPGDRMEQADVFFLLVQLAGGPEALAAACREKLDINKARTWGEPDADGVVEHVR